MFVCVYVRACVYACMHACVGLCPRIYQYKYNKPLAESKNITENEEIKKIAVFQITAPCLFVYALINVKSGQNIFRTKYHYIQAP